MHTYSQIREREFETTKKVLQAFPHDKLDLKPAEKSKDARNLAWVFVVEERLIKKLMVGGEPDFSSKPPATMAEILSALDEAHAETNEVLQGMSASDLKKTATFFVAPKTKGEVPKEDLLWMMLFDSIHHRGQFTVYSRLAGGKVPSIYGPSADEPWN